MKKRLSTCCSSWRPARIERAAVAPTGQSSAAPPRPANWRIKAAGQALVVGTSTRLRALRVGGCRRQFR